MSSSKGERPQDSRAAGPGRAVAVVAVVVVVAALIGLSLRSGSSEPDGAGGDFGVALSEAGCEPVEEFEDDGADHVENGTEVDYADVIPTSGTHWQAPADAGFYQEPMEVAQLVHNLEHGQVVIYYSSLESDQLADLEDYVIGTGALVAAPAPAGVESSITLAAWTKLQSCEQLSSEALDAFRKQFQGRGPEPITPPYEG